jgi:hypothetical protein
MSRGRFLQCYPFRNMKETYKKSYKIIFVTSFFYYFKTLSSQENNQHVYWLSSNSHKTHKTECTTAWTKMTVLHHVASHRSKKGNEGEGMLSTIGHIGIWKTNFPSVGFPYFTENSGQGRLRINFYRHFSLSSQGITEGDISILAFPF